MSGHHIYILLISSSSESQQVRDADMQATGTPTHGDTRHGVVLVHSCCRPNSQATFPKLRPGSLRTLITYAPVEQARAARRNRSKSCASRTLSGSRTSATPPCEPRLAHAPTYAGHRRALGSRAAYNGGGGRLKLVRAFSRPTPARTVSEPPVPIQINVESVRFAINPPRRPCWRRHAHQFTIMHSAPSRHMRAALPMVRAIELPSAACAGFPARPPWPSRSARSGRPGLVARPDLSRRLVALRGRVIAISHSLHCGGATGRRVRKGSIRSGRGGPRTSAAAPSGEDQNTLRRGR